MRSQTRGSGPPLPLSFAAGCAPFLRRISASALDLPLAQGPLVRRAVHALSLFQEAAALQAFGSTLSHALPAQGSGSAVAPVREIHLAQSGNAVIEVPQAQRLSILELLILKSVISLSRT